ncbi:FMN-dependent NADH-azoreductase [Verminephrobacter eiseniae]|uniref:FMN-dependent NADH-azoreductase n=1 Tax=Verminephrobacter eiseniae TaxID=364317 RepID=UPI002237C5AD|nr:NAD(P)H-dependent oxidoreductase [Verminephrobacter eiseniae]MCW5235646.1 flavodoxin family protein [Verminephrobacter eiseniae]
MKLLHINASTRGVDSESLKISTTFIAELRNHTELALDTFNLSDDELPEFDGLAVGAKMALFSGSGFSSEQTKAWERIKLVFDRFAAADAYVFNTPLWNNGIPYKLKQFIDVVTQPGWAFGFDVEKGYSGLLNGRKALVIHASGVYHTGIAAGFGSDFSTPYIDDWLKFIGVQSVEHIHVAPTVMNTDFAKTKTDAEIHARQVAKAWTSRI